MMNRSTILKAGAAACLLLAASSAAAGPLVAQRGYTRCVNDLTDAYPRSAALVHSRYYYLAQSRDDMTFYVNSTAWEQGDRVALKTRCATDRFGRRLLSRDTDYGRWVPARGKVTVEEVSNR